MPPRRTPDMIALEVLECVEENGQATKWDLIKILGNERQFRLWIEKFFLLEGVLVEDRDGNRYRYEKTQRGELFHKLLRTGSLIKLFTRVSGRRLR